MVEVCVQRCLIRTRDSECFGRPLLPTGLLLPVGTVRDLKQNCRMTKEGRRGAGNHSANRCECTAIPCTMQVDFYTSQDTLPTGVTYLGGRPRIQEKLGFVSKHVMGWERDKHIYVENTFVTPIDHYNGNICHGAKRSGFHHCTRHCYVEYCPRRRTSTNI